MIEKFITELRLFISQRSPKITVHVFLFIALTLCQVSHAQADVITAMLGQGEIPLNGPWAFRMGNDYSWANPQFDDSHWDQLDLTPPPGSHDGDVGLPGYVPGWASKGYSGRWGHAWYRLRVRWNMPAGSVPVLSAPTLVDGAYEIYWNGKRIGGIGDFSPAQPTIYASRPKLFQLGEKASSGEAVIAIHVYLPKDMATDAEAGGMHVAPILAEPAAGANLYLAQWWLTFWGYIADLVEPLMLIALALFGISLNRFSRRDRFLPLMAAAISAIALSRLTQPLLFWTELETIPMYNVIRFGIFNPAAIVFWVMACYRLGGFSDRRIDALICMFGVLAGIAALPGIEARLLLSIARLGLLLLFFGSIFYVVRASRLRLLAIPAILLVGIAIFADELSMIGVKGIWFPFGVGVSRTQYALAIAIPVLAVFVYFRTVVNIKAD